MGLFFSPNQAAVMNSLPPDQRGAGAGMLNTFQNSATVLSMGLFFTIVTLGLAADLPSHLYKGLVNAGVSPSAAHVVANEPPIGSLFSAFLGYNPIKELLGPTGALQHLSPSQLAYITGRTFFPKLIEQPFASGLHLAFTSPPSRPPWPSSRPPCAASATCTPPSRSRRNWPRAPPRPAGHGLGRALAFRRRPPVTGKGTATERAAGPGRASGAASADAVRFAGKQLSCWHDGAPWRRHRTRRRAPPAASETLLGIGAAAARAGVSERALRYYQQLGLLVPACTPPGGLRRYSEEDLARVARIRELQTLLGLNLDEIAVVLRNEDRLAQIRLSYHDERTSDAERRRLAASA